MTITNCTISDIDDVILLYNAARALQTERQMVVWPYFPTSFIEKEISVKRQWKIVIDDVIACNWAIAFEYREIWGERDQNNAIYIHRICTAPAMRGKKFIEAIVTWAKEYAALQGKQFIRLDTLGNNTKLIEHYTSAGFNYLGMFQLTDTANLPAHYQQEPNCCLFELSI